MMCVPMQRVRMLRVFGYLVCMPTSRTREKSLFFIAEGLTLACLLLVGHPSFVLVEGKLSKNMFFVQTHVKSNQHSMGQQKSHWKRLPWKAINRFNSNPNKLCCEKSA